MRIACLYTASTVLLFACAGSSSDDGASSSTSHVETGDITPGADAIVVQQAERVFSTKIAEDGRSIEQALDHSMLLGEKVLTAKHDRASGSFACSFGPGGAPQTGRFESSQLVLAEPNGATLVLVPGRPKVEGTFELVQGSEVRGNLGPYAFVRESVYHFGCGAAHPSFSMTAFVWDLAKREKVAFAAPSTALDRARVALAGRGFESEPKLAELIPRFDDKGRFSVGWRFEKAASHAESDGAGSDFTISTVVESTELGEALPPELDALKEPPASVAAYLAASPFAVNPMIGWSRAD